MSYKRSWILSVFLNGILLLMLLCLSVTCLLAQPKTDTLKEVRVHGLRSERKTNDSRINDFLPGEKINNIDSITLSTYKLQNVSALLSQQLPVFVRSYGFNNLATLNFRGSSEAQTEVLWNGVPINNAALGAADVSLLPVFLVSNISIVYGSSAALLGSGNVGGALLLENDHPVFDSVAAVHLAASCGIGSFAQNMQGIKMQYSSRRWYLSLHALLQQATNDFPYTSLAGNSERMPNAHLYGSDIMLLAAHKLSTYSTLSLSAWYQQYLREIPPALFETYSSKKQRDASLRLLLNWDKERNRNKWYAKGAFIHDYMHYQDTSVGLVSDNITSQYYFEAGYERTMNNSSRLLFFLPAQVSQIMFNAPQQVRQQERAALAAAYNIGFWQYRLNIAVNVREEMVNNNSNLLPGANSSFRICNWLSVRGNVQRTYRVPTLNELYYMPGGNTTLKPEQGWNEDAGCTLKVSSPKIVFSNDVSFFNRDIRNWIIWFGGAIWTPHNIANVSSRGVETDNRLEWRLNVVTLHISVNTSYVLATTVSSYIVNDGSIGKQIPYTPRYNARLNVGISYKNCYLNYNHTYTGYRFITTDESEYLPPYQTGNVQLLYSFAVRRHGVQLSAQCNNIWNQHYQVVAYRPMPGINYMAGFNIDLVN